MHIRRWLAILTALTMIGAVSVAPAAAGHGAGGKVCVVNSFGGDQDPFNASAAEGTKAARAKLHVDTETLNATTGAEIVANIDAFVAAGDCDLIFGVGFIVAFLMQPAILANTGQSFVILDAGIGSGLPNVADVIIESDQGAFLAGYLAAGVTETGKVGVFGGLPIRPVTWFMDGYALGVEWYNEVTGASVEVLGWDPDLQTGLFSFDFGDRLLGQALTADLYDQGADVVFPVAGLTSLGALDEAAVRTAAGDTARVIGVDSDFSQTFGDPDQVILTSVLKNVGPALFNQVAALVDGTWAAGEVLEGLESGTSDIAPFNKLNRAVPGFLKNDLKSIRTGIIHGTISTRP